MKVTAQWEGPDRDVTTVAVEEPVDGVLVLDAMCVAARDLLLELIGDREPTDP